MNSIGVATLCAVVVMASADSADPRHFDLSIAPQHFADFMTKFNRTYKDDADKDVHYAAFVENLKKINKLNKENTMATFGINKFADYTEEESKMMRGFRAPDKKDSK